jgi:hypothetical protein
MACSDVTRGQLGTTARIHGADSKVYDVTVLVETAQRILNRAESGAPEIDVVTDYTQYAVQIGDLVCVDDDLLAAIGLSSTVKWEVVSKNAELTGSPPCIKWRLVRAAPASATADTVTPRKRFPPGFYLPPSTRQGPALIDGGILHIGASGRTTIDQDNLFFDVDEHRLGIRTKTPSQALEILGGDALLSTASNGSLTITAQDGSNFRGVFASAGKGLYLGTNGGIDSGGVVSILHTGEIGVGVTNPTANYGLTVSAFSGLSQFVGKDHGTICVTPNLATPKIGTSTAHGIDIATNGTARCRVASDAAKLHVGAEGTYNIALDASGATPSIGTTTNHPLLIKTNGTETARMTAAGRFGIGCSVPSSVFDVRGIITVGDTQDGTGDRTNITIEPSTETTSPGIFTGEEMDLALGCDAVETMRLPDGGFLGLGTASPGVHFHIRAAACSEPWAATTVMGIEQDDSSSIEFHVPTTKIASLMTTDTDGHVQAFWMDHSSDTIGWIVKSNDRMKLQADGGLLLVDTGATIDAPASDWIVMWADGASIKFKDSGGKTATITLS